MNRPSLICAGLAALALASAASAPADAQSGGDTRRRTIAITYFRDPVKVALAGTTLRPAARGDATVERWRKRNTSEIDITVSNLVPAFNYGADYTTYVLWAITPAGQVDNLGEFRLSGGSGRLKTATAHQTFAMMVTAEPHYLVRLPSRMVMLENLTPVSSKVHVQATEVFFTGDSGRYYTDNSVPSLAERDFSKTPMELLQARRAIQIAKLADAERFSPNDYTSARRSLDQAEEAFRRGANVHEVGRISRESITFAVRARDIAEEKALAAERRAEISRRDAEVRRATETATGLQEELDDTKSRLRASELARANSEDQMARTLRDLTDAKAESRSARDENARLNAEIARLRQELTAAREEINNLRAQNSTATARLSDAASRLDSLERTEKERQATEARKRDFEALRAELAGFLNVKSSGGGFTAVLPDSFFVANQTSLALKVKAQMDKLGQILASHPDVRFVIESHCDSRAAAESFSAARAQSVADYIAAYGVSQSNFRIEARGSTVPVASNKTVRGKSANRRVELVFSGPH